MIGLIDLNGAVPWLPESWLDTEITALSETWLIEEDILSEIGAGYTFFWIGCSRHEHCDPKVGFAIRSNLVNKLAGPPKDVSDCLMTVQPPLSGKQHVTIVSACAPIKERFCHDLKSMIAAVTSTDKCIILSDSNARIGTDSSSLEGVLWTKCITAATEIALCYRKPVLNVGSSLPTPSFICPFRTRCHGCILTQSTDTYWTISL